MELSIDFSKMSLEEMLAPAEQEPFPPKESESCEVHLHKTPSGGDLSVAYFFDENGHSCPRNKAKRMNIVEYLKDGTRINESYGVMGQ